MTYNQRFKTIDERFSEKYSVQPNGCWEWKTGIAHPRFWTGDKHEKASRYIWQKTKNVRLIVEQHVCHKCDNPICVNVDHMFIGSHSDNMRDKAAKGRASRCIGMRNGRAKIDQSAAEEIRILYKSGGISQQKIADQFNLCQTHVSHIVRGVSW